MKKVLIIPLCMVIALSCSSRQRQVRTETKAVQKETSRDRIAVLDLKGDDIPRSKTKMISELIRTEIINTNKFIVIERSQVDMIFKEHGFTSTGVTDDSSAAKVGKLLAAQKILIGSVMKLGDSMVITSRVVDVERGVAEVGAKVSADDTNLMDEVSDLVAQLTGSIEDVGVKSAKIVVRADKKLYKVNEDIVVTFKNFPGTRYDYISVAKATASARDHYSYQYTGGDKEGSVTFNSGVRNPGEYEVRAHTEYAKGNYTITAKYKIKVVE